jgi:putative cell wall-binding protein
LLNRVRRVAPALLRPEGAALTVGIIAFVVWLVWRAVFPPLTTVDVARYQGEDRYATAAELALAARPNGARSAILARGDDFADALSAGALVGPTDGVVLLTDAETIPAPTRAALQELNVGIVYLMGGPAAISDVVRTELEDSYQVLRLSGDNRFATAAAVARELAERDAIGTVEQRRTAFVVNGETFPDAVAASSASAAGGFPILLTSTDALPEETTEVLEELDIGRVIVVGGSATIGLPVIIALEQGGYLIEEISGDDRAGTAVAVAERFVTSTLALDGNAAVLARGDDFPDGLAAGSYAGIIGAPLLLAPQPDVPGRATLRYLDARQETGDLDRLVIVGGEAAITPEAVEAAHQAALGQAAVPDPSPAAATDAP